MPISLNELNDQVQRQDEEIAALKIVTNLLLTAAPTQTHDAIISGLREVINETNQRLDAEGFDPADSYMLQALAQFVGDQKMTYSTRPESDEHSPE